MKVLGWFIVGLAVVLIAIGVFVAMNSGSLIERAMETYGSRYLGAPVEVDDVDVSFSEGSARVAGLVVNNPEGFSGPPALELGSIDVVLDTSSTSSELVVLDAVAVDGARVAAQARGSRLNLKQLMDNLDSQTAANEQAEETGVESEVRLIIDRFSFTNASASAESDVLGDANMDIPDIQLTDIGREAGGATVGEVLEQVLEPIFDAVSREMLNRGVDLQGARDQVEERAREEMDERLGDGLESMTEKLRNGS
ncbi:MAG: hypothetical protein ACODAC_05195 [Pseudomonadota bacterium]